MSTLNQTVWIKQYAVPALLVIALGPIWILIWGDLNILAFGAAFVLAFVTGLLLRPGTPGSCRLPSSLFLLPSSTCWRCWVRQNRKQMSGLSQASRSSLDCH
jgi:hypothetical protein